SNLPQESGMPRWGQASRSANALRLLSRPITRGISSNMAFCSPPCFTFSDGSARYQKPVSISESGASRFSVSGAAMRKVSVSHSWCGSDILVRQMTGGSSKRLRSRGAKENSKVSEKTSDAQNLLGERIRAAFGNQTGNGFFCVSSIGAVRKDLEICPIIINRLGGIASLVERLRKAIGGDGIILFVNEGVLVAFNGSFVIFALEVVIAYLHVLGCFVRIPGMQLLHV